jgi:biopolymer transport protein ExbB
MKFQNLKVGLAHLEKALDPMIRKTRLFWFVSASLLASTFAASAQTLDNSPVKAVLVGMRELSPWTMFLNASLVAQSIMVGLVFASLVTWTIFLAKEYELFVSKRRLSDALDVVANAKSLTQAASLLSNDKSVMRRFVAAALNETKLSSGIENEAGIKERAASSFTEITRAESGRIRIGMGVLATIGATSPFVGLFGTVWGIMNSFIGISKLQTTNLAVVAPGIAEALLATAIGLFAAIPAVVIYNHFARGIRNYFELVNRASGAAGRQLSRDLDRMGAKAFRRAAE